MMKSDGRRLLSSHREVLGDNVISRLRKQIRCTEMTDACRPKIFIVQCRIQLRLRSSVIVFYVRHTDAL